MSLAAVVLTLTACTGEGNKGGSLPASPPVVRVVMDEYGFDVGAGSQAGLPRGRVVFRARNAGQLAHEVVLSALPEDMPPIGEQLRSPTRRALHTVVRLDQRRPGETGFFAVDLVKGRYALLCFVPDTDGEIHAKKGMATELQVR